MERYFNIGGPCLPAQHYMLPAMARLPQVVSLIRKMQYFVVHAQRQCGKTTAFLSLANEMNAKGDAVAIKLKYNYEKNPEKAYAQVLCHVDHLGQSEGWLVVFDPKLGDWDAKLRHEDVVRDGKTVHVFFC